MTESSRIEFDQGDDDAPESSQILGMPNQNRYMSAPRSGALSFT